jgi:hypothetical protein
MIDEVALDEDTVVPQIIRLYRKIPVVNEFLHALPRFAIALSQGFKKISAINRPYGSLAPALSND